MPPRSILPAWALIAVSIGLDACSSSSGGDSDTSTVSVTHGPVLGVLSEQSASIWLRVDSDRAIKIEWEPETGAVDRRTLQQMPSEDYTMAFGLDRLQPDTCYAYRFTEGDKILKRSSRFRFCTQPLVVNDFKIGLMADLDYRSSIDAPAIGRLADRDPDLILLVGDWDHRDAASLEEFRVMHLENRDSRKLASRWMINRLFRSVPIGYVWDDHDYGGNNSDRFADTRSAALQAYDEYWPTPDRPNPIAGIWHRRLIGDLVDIYMLDTRSQRDPDTYRDTRFVPDGSPGANRGTLRNDPQRSMLDGAEAPEGFSTGQKSWLKTSLLSSPALWKIIVSSVTFNETTVKDDAWWDFLAERNELVDHIRGNGITGVIIVSADLHTGGGIDDGSNADIPEVTLPAINLNQTVAGNPSCAIHPSPDRAVRTTCGEWSHGYAEHGSGFGFITLSRTRATIETSNMLGEHFDLEIPAGQPISLAASGGQ